MITSAGSDRVRCGLVGTVPQRVNPKQTIVNFLETLAGRGIIPGSWFLIVLAAKSGLPPLFCFQ